MTFKEVTYPFSFKGTTHFLFRDKQELVGDDEVIMMIAATHCTNLPPLRCVGGRHIEVFAGHYVPQCTTPSNTRLDVPKVGLFSDTNHHSLLLLERMPHLERAFLDNLHQTDVSTLIAGVYVTVNGRILEWGCLGVCRFHFGIIQPPSFVGKRLANGFLFI